MSTILFINTSESESEVALIVDSDVLANKAWTAEKNLGSELLPQVLELLESNSLTLDDLTAIAVHPGPGSFTGTRIGVTTANTLAWSRDIPVVASTTPEQSQQLVSKTSAHFTTIVIPIYDRDPAVTHKRLPS